MIRFGRSWRTDPYGGRAWVSAGWPFWVFGGLLSGMYWLFIGWWLWLGVGLVCMTVWLLTQLLLLLASGLVWSLQTARHGRRGVVVRWMDLRYGLTAFDTEVRRA